MKTIDIWSKGEVAGHLLELIKSGQVRDCKHLEVERDWHNSFVPKCTKDWASRIPAENVLLDDSGYDAPNSYFWPGCQSDCPKYAKSSNMSASLAGEDEAGSVQSEVKGVSVPSVDDKTKPELVSPEKVTIPWLLRHVPISLWLAAAGLLIGAFVAGVKASSLTIIREVFGLK